MLAELDYLPARRVGQSARTGLLGEVERGAYQLQPFSSEDVQAARTIIVRHADLGISLAEASIAVLATRHHLRDVLPRRTPLPRPDRRRRTVPPVAR